MTYWNTNRQAFLDDLAQRIKPKRYQHVLRVEQTAIELAERYGADAEAVSIAALAHDYAKDLDVEQARVLAQTFWPQVDLSQEGSNILHGPAAAQILLDRYGVTDRRILEAVAGHTVGWYQFDLIGKILYLADYMEPGRDFPGVELARELVANDLDAACWYKMKRTLTYLIEKEKTLFDGAVEIYNRWCQEGI